MLHFVRGDGGHVMIPKEELVRWLREKDSALGTSTVYIDDLLTDRDIETSLEAMGR